MGFLEGKSSSGEIPLCPSERWVGVGLIIGDGLGKSSRVTINR